MAYDESNIKSLSSLEHIRLRPGMYIGRLGNGSHPDDGIYILLKEIIDNSVDEFTMKHGNRIEVTIIDDTVSVRDYGRGIPLGKVVECVSVINTGAKYDSEAFQFSVGLNGVGTKAVNALSSTFLVRSYREGKYVEATFKEGVLDKEKKGSTKEPDGTFISFRPDPALFPDFHYLDDIVLDRLWSYAYLNTGLTIEYNKTIIKSQHGLLDLLTKVLGGEGLYPTIHFKNEHLEFAFTHTSGYGENYFSYVNGQNTSDGGTHLAAFKEGVLKGINEFFRKSWQAPEIRDGIVAAIAIKMQNPVFESQTKNKLGSTEVRTWIVNEVKEAVLEALLKDKAIAQGLALDGGLLTPEVLPKLSPNGLKTMTDMSYQQRAVFVMGSYLDDFTASELSSFAKRAYGPDKFDTKAVAPVRQLDDRTYCLELWHGPTCAFKDMALQMLPHLLSASLVKNQEEKTQTHQSLYQQSISEHLVVN